MESDAAPSVDDYEVLPTHSVAVHMVAGAAAGIMEHCVMYPIDSVKTRMQSLCPCPERSCKTPVSGLISMVKREGIWRPIRGVNVIATSAVPAHALYFSVYEKMKFWLTDGHAGYHPLSHGIAGIAATLVHDAIMNPAEVVKQRMQMWASPYRGCVECARCVFKGEGVCAFYRSYTTQLLMNVPFQSTHFIVYEFWQQLLNPRHEYDPKSHLIAGAIAGGAAAALTTPLDVIKTTLNTQEVRTLEKHCPGSVNGFRDAVNMIYRYRGMTGFFGGLQARILFQMPATALSWSVYEFFKFALSLTERRTNSSSTTSVTAIPKTS